MNHCCWSYKNDWKFEKKNSEIFFCEGKWRIFWNIENFEMKYSQLIKFQHTSVGVAFYHGNCLWSNVFFPSILWWIQSGNHLVGNWAKRGYKLNMKILKNKKYCYVFGYLFELIIKIWPFRKNKKKKILKIWGIWVIFFMKSPFLGWNLRKEVTLIFFQTMCQKKERRKCNLLK